jgi:bis(5'-nucleosyl)-tetraphosphatase (symmetrical)
LEKRIAQGELSLDDPDLQFLTRVRYCDVNGHRSDGSNGPPPGHAPWDHFYDGPRIVVCGHWSMRGLVTTDRLRALDSGCVWGGTLTAWIAEEDRLISVPARKVYQQPG